MVLSTIRAWWRRTFRPAPDLDPGQWAQGCRKVRGLRHLEPSERELLKPLVRQFLHEKVFVPVEGFELETEHRYIIAIAACIPILHLGMSAYRKFRSIYVFPGAFRPSHPEQWRPGALHGAIAGLAVQGGGVALAWTAAAEGVADDDDGQNTIIHEFAHKLDMLDGAADGRPPLPDGVSQADWFEAFSAAFRDFQTKIERRHRTRLDAYAATNPAEFFAVLSEVYFEQPEVLKQEYPRVFALLRAFYRQEPLGTGSG